jgi:hypothetical protein
MSIVFVKVMISETMSFDADANPVYLEPAARFEVDSERYSNFIGECITCGYQDELVYEGGVIREVRLWFDTMRQWINWYIGATR